MSLLFILMVISVIFAVISMVIPVILVNRHTVRSADYIVVNDIVFCKEQHNIITS